MTTVRDAVAQRENTPAKPSPRDVLRHLLADNAAAVGASLPSGMSQERFVRLLLTAANANPALFECDPRSFLAAGVMAAQLGLEPNDPRGLAWLIPFNDRKRGKVVVFIIGYRGLLELARRSGHVTSIHVFPVFEGDQFTYRFGLDPTVDHVPAADGDEDPAKLLFCYASALVDGDVQFVVMNRRQIDAIRDRAPSSKASSSPWKTDYVEMAKKTVIRRLCKYLPLTVEAATAVAVDERPLVLGDLGVAPAADDEETIETTAIEAAEGETGAAEERGESDAAPATPDADELKERFEAGQ